jgi:hypothetical protein
VLAQLKFAPLIFDLAPHAMQMNGMVHHRVVDQYDSQTLAVAKRKRLAL